MEDMWTVQDTFWEFMKAEKTPKRSLITANQLSHPNNHWTWKELFVWSTLFSTEQQLDGFPSRIPHLLFNLLHLAVREDNWIKEQVSWLKKPAQNPNGLWWKG